MPNVDSYIMMGLGGFFALLGVLAFLWGRHEERGYYDALSGRRDLREFLTRLPQHIEPEALRIGGRILIVVGLVLVIVGGILLL